MGRDDESLPKSCMLGVDILIFVTLGTQDKQFTRLLRAVQEQIDQGNLKKEDKIIVQAGSTKFQSNDMQIFQYISIKQFEKYVDQADLIICHAGVGTILTALNKGKKVIAAARLKKYGEHVNDHQLQILNNFSKAGYILALKKFQDLNLLLEQAKDFQPQKFESNHQYFIGQLEKKIKQLCT